MAYDDQKTKDPSDLGDEHMRQITGIHPNEEAAMEGRAKKGAAKDKAKRLSAEELKKAEVGGKSDQVGKGYRTSTSSDGSRVRQLISKATSKKKAIVGGSAGTVFIVLFVIALVTIIPYELVHLEKNLLKEQAKVEQRFEKKAAQKIFDKITCRFLPISAKCKEDPQPEDPDTAKADGEALSENIDEFDIAGETKTIEASGFKLTFDTDGKLTSFKGPSGEDITGEISDADFAALESALPEWSVGQIEAYRPLMVDHAAASFSGIPEGTAPEDVDKVVDAKVAEGADSTDIANAATSEQEGELPSNDTNPADAASLAESNQVGGQLGKALSAAEQAAADGQTGEQAVQAGVSSFDISPGNALLATSLITTACSVQKDVKKASDARIPTIITLLVRHGTTLISLADQLKTGHITGDQVGQIMKIFNGDSSAVKTADNPNPEAALPFNNSAAWHRDTGGTVDSSPTLADGKTANPGFNPDISSSALPTASTGTHIVNSIQGILNKTGGSFTCGVLTSTFGSIIQGFAGAVQLIADFGSFGLTQAGITTALITAQETIKHVILPDIIKYFTPLGINGLEDSVQWLNNSDAGLDLSFSDYGRSMGAVPQTADSANKLSALANQDQARQASRESLGTRLFATDNPNSLVWQITNHLPIGLTNTAASFTSYLASFPAILLHNLANLTLPHSFAASTNPNTASCGDPYCITKYAFSDSEVSKYDPVGNEQYLFGTLSYGGKTMKRIDMLGNPNTYQPSAAGDPNNNDLLHCFVDGYSVLSNKSGSSGSAVRKYCGSIGTYDFNNDHTVVPGDDTVAKIYCQALAGSDTDSGCLSSVASQINDDVTHFREYLLDVHVMSDYESLTNNT